MTVQPIVTLSVSYTHLEGKMIAFSREYKKKLMDDSEVICFMTITDKIDVYKRQVQE